MIRHQIAFILFTIYQIHSFFSSVSEFKLFKISLTDSVFNFSTSSLEGSLTTIDIDSPSSSHLGCINHSRLASINSLTILRKSSSKEPCCVFHREFYIYKKLLQSLLLYKPVYHCHHPMKQPTLWHPQNSDSLKKQ